MGFGFCFNLPVSTHPAGSCDAIYSKAQFCPVFGLPNQCHNPPISNDQNLTAVTVGGMNCVLDAPCQRSTVDPNSKILWANYLCTATPTSLFSCIFGGAPPLYTRDTHMHKALLGAHAYWMLIVLAIRWYGRLPSSGTPREFERASGACAWTSGPCQFSPYFRPVPGGGAEAPPGGLPY